MTLVMMMMMQSTTAERRRRTRSKSRRTSIRIESRRPRRNAKRSFRFYSVDIKLFLTPISVVTSYEILNIESCCNLVFFGKCQCLNILWQSGISGNDKRQ